MRLRLYVDEDAMSKPLIKALRSRGVDVITASDVHMDGEDDDRHLDYAASAGRTLYSFNVKDYPTLHLTFWEQGRTHAGIILGTNSRYSVGEQMRRLLRLIDAKSSDDMLNQLEYLGGWR